MTSIGAVSRATIVVGTRPVIWHSWVKVSMTVRAAPDGHGSILSMVVAGVVISVGGCCPRVRYVVDVEESAEHVDWAVDVESGVGWGDPFPDEQRQVFDMSRDPDLCTVADTGFGRVGLVPPGMQLP